MSVIDLSIFHNYHKEGHKMIQDMYFTRRNPDISQILFVLYLDKARMKERILIGDEVTVRRTLEGNDSIPDTVSDILIYDKTDKMGSMLINFPEDIEGNWNRYGIMPLYNALHTNRWEQPAFEKTASDFFVKASTMDNPVSIYAASRIWNEYLVARMKRNRSEAAESFITHTDALIRAFRAMPASSHDEATGSPVRFNLHNSYFDRIPIADTRMELWYTDNYHTRECIAIKDSLFPAIIYYLNRLSDWKLVFRCCKICGKVFLAPNLKYELCSDKCRKKQALQNKREFDIRARENNYDLLYKNECQNWRNKINKAKKSPNFPPKKLEEMEAAFNIFKTEAKKKKTAVKNRQSSYKEFADWIYSQNNIIVSFL